MTDRSGSSEADDETVESTDDAAAVARTALSAEGQESVQIEEVHRTTGTWVVHADTDAGSFRVHVDAANGSTRVVRKEQ